ncbi:hypothetical protein DPMN_021886 [Dreissena polymorpha]|uniref:Uncharacterized protein n=3 Tax=Dreissena polymorpha TaxID=45954 RepID=A0A9D4SC41_DREPO|nr:hypothetical protein DPMN_021886 [Dreissena polymorpha]
MDLVAVQLSADICLCKEFLQEQSQLSLTHGNQEQKNSIVCHGVSGVFGIKNEVKIPLKPLRRSHSHFHLNKLEVSTGPVADLNGNRGNLCKKRFGFTGGDGGSSDKKRKGKEESKRKYEGKKKEISPEMA